MMQQDASISAALHHQRKKLHILSAQAHLGDDGGGGMVQQADGVAQQLAVAEGQQPTLQLVVSHGAAVRQSSQRPAQVLQHIAVTKGELHSVRR